MLLGIISMPVQGTESQSAHEQKNKAIMYVLPAGIKSIQIQSAEQDPASYWDMASSVFPSQLVSQALMVVFGAYVYMYVHQHTKDTIGNQTMQIYYPGDIKVSLSDVAGLEGAKADMQNIISYLASPQEYADIGAKIPKGVLMNGAPGNGKTLLARAVAGTVNCPFISVAGASFVQMYAGLGAARVRDLFARAEQLAAEYGGCIIFIDEIDAIANKRSAVHSGGDREHGQTVAQLLECMDGLQNHEHPIIVLGATNRVELLDDAVMRPGRFDHKVEITKPYLQDRVTLIKLALDNVKYVHTVDIESLARITAGFSGAELANLVNSAAILAIEHGRNVVAQRDLELAFDHIVLGREITTMQQIPEDIWVTAVHEAGHAAGWLFGNDTRHVIHKASITPRSHTLGVVWATPLYEKHSHTQHDMKSKIIVTLCGGLAEKEFGFDKSTGMSNDLAKAYALAYEMVSKYGMSSTTLQYISYDGIHDRLPDAVATPVYEQAKKIVDECLVIAQELVVCHKEEISAIAQLLMEKGTVLGKEIYETVGLPMPTMQVQLAI